MLLIILLLANLDWVTPYCGQQYSYGEAPKFFLGLFSLTDFENESFNWPVIHKELALKQFLLNNTESARIIDICNSQDVLINSILGFCLNETESVLTYMSTELTILTAQLLTTCKGKLFSIVTKYLDLHETLKPAFSTIAVKTNGHFEYQIVTSGFNKFDVPLTTQFTTSCNTCFDGIVFNACNCFTYGTTKPIFNIVFLSFCKSSDDSQCLCESAQPTAEISQYSREYVINDGHSFQSMLQEISIEKEKLIFYVLSTHGDEAQILERLVPEIRERAYVILQRDRDLVFKTSFSESVFTTFPRVTVKCFERNSTECVQETLLPTS